MTRTPAQLSRHVDADGSIGARPTRPQHEMTYTIQESPLGSSRRVRIVGIGAGASGLNLIRSLRQNLAPDSYELVIYEKNGAVGGTWHENRYPGCRCDVPSHNYQFSWRQNPEWTNFCAPAAEINEYLQRTAEEEGMLPCIRLSHRIIGALWDESAACWRINVKNLETGAEFGDSADFLVDASGILNNWKWPEIEGLQTFSGSLIHSANWPEDIDLKDKTVVVIGNGASGVQIVPAIQPVVKKLYHSIRTPTWILPPRLATMKMMASESSIIRQIETGPNDDFTPAQIARFKSDPAFYSSFINAIDDDASKQFGIVASRQGAPQQWAAAKAAEYMAAMLGGDARLCGALIPSFPLGCRRLTPAPGYLECMRAANVELVTEGIRKVVPEGLLLENGELLRVDVMICATGFDNSFRPPFPLIGRGGKNLQHVWTKTTPAAYMSLAVPGVPNYFKFFGPNAPIAHGSVFSLSEHVADYMARAIRRCQTQGIRTLAPSRAAVDDYAAHIAAFMPRTAWAGGCRSWYKSGGAGSRSGEGEADDGAVTAVHPGSRRHFVHMLEEFRGEDWEYTYLDKGGNRFAYLGNGFSTRDGVGGPGMK